MNKFSISSGFWKRPVDYLQSRSDKWLLVVFNAVYIPLFLLLFQPFGVNNYDPTHRIGLEFFLAALSFGLVGGLTILVYEFWLVRLFFRSSQQTWLTLLGHIFLELIFLASVFFLYYNVLGEFHDWKLASYFEFIWQFLIMGIIPTGVVLLYLEYKNVRRAYDQVQTGSTPDSPSEKLIHLTSGNGKEFISILSDTLLYIEAQGNYVFVYYLENGEIKKSLLRTTMKKLERQLQLPSVIRCHRSFIVNTRQVTKVTGNAHQFQLHLSEGTTTIPVSRSYIPRLEKYLDIHPV